MTDFWRSIIRTATPIVAGWLVAGALRLGVEIDATWAAQAVSAVLAVAWYVLARALESWKPEFGWLLGSPKPPSYGEPT